jgi:hypothetical protein
VASFTAEVEAFIERRSDQWVWAALAELGLEYVDDVMPDDRAYFMGRIEALWEEAE